MKADTSAVATDLLQHPLTSAGHIPATSIHTVRIQHAIHTLLIIKLTVLWTCHYDHHWSVDSICQTPGAADDAYSALQAASGPHSSSSLSSSLSSSSTSLSSLSSASSTACPLNTKNLVGLVMAMPLKSHAPATCRQGRAAYNQCTAQAQ